MTRVIHSVEEMILWRRALSTNSVGFVPTMGALHDGHKSLMERSHSENEVSVLSIFVNPTQFNNPKDLATYPRALESDLKMAEDCGFSVVFAPEYSQMYPDDFKYKVVENELSQKFCGAFRPGHFEGVLTVVLKLFNIVQARRAYFGEKDYQQLKLVEGLVKAFFVPTEIVACSTVREKDGLAMSSRNTRLTDSARQIAPSIYETLTEEKDLKLSQEKLETLGFKVEYLDKLDDRKLIAAFLNDVRLIDNVPL